MPSNFPTALDDDSSLFQVTDSVTSLVAAHHNNPKDAIKALEAKLGIYSSGAPTSIDYRLGNPTGGHRHDGASGQGGPVSLENLDIVGASISGLLHFITMERSATMVVGSNVAAPLIMGRTLQLQSIQAALRRGPSGATTALDVLVGPTSFYQASQGFRPIFPPGATAYRSSATPNLITYPSGAVVTLDVDAVGSSEPGQDLRITFVFRD